MEGFRIDLKTFLGLAMPNQYCLTLKMYRYQVGFGVISLDQNPQTLNLVLPYYMMILTDQ